MAGNKRINWLLILQGWAMLWVVIGHAFIGKTGERPEYVDVLFNFAYSFHMPLFMLVSGWLFYMTRLKPANPNGGGVQMVLLCDNKRQEYPTPFARISVQYCGASFENGFS